MSTDNMGSRSIMWEAGILYSEIMALADDLEHVDWAQYRNIPAEQVNYIDDAIGVLARVASILDNLSRGYSKHAVTKLSVATQRLIGLLREKLKLTGKETTIALGNVSAKSATVNGTSQAECRGVQSGKDRR